jgi:chromosome segregation ATPase
MENMNDFIRKAISLFVVLEDEKQAAPAPPAPTAQKQNEPAPKPLQHAKPMAEADLSKFEKHFSELFEKANLPGPDYFEFWRMMDTLESHIPEEKARMKAVFDSLRIQGLNKAVLLDTAGQYKEIVITDRNSFESAVQKKFESEVESRKKAIRDLESSRAEKEKQIARLQQEMAEAAAKVESLKAEILAEENKIVSAQNGYLMACNAMISKIGQDIETFRTVIPD